MAMPKPAKAIVRRKPEDERREFERNVRYTEEEYKTILAGADAVNEHFAEFVRTAALERADGLC